MIWIVQNSYLLKNEYQRVIAFVKGETKPMTKMKKILSFLLLTVMIAVALTGCSDDNTQSFQSMEDFEEAKIGVLTGSSFDLLAKAYFRRQIGCTI